MEINYEKDLTVFDKLLEPILSFVRRQDQGLPKHPGQTFSGVSHLAHKKSSLTT